ncbi:hypothetical protein DSC45_22945 [Streptomyces sp. YIM 130001]|uniref:hypothetical protein n=1 Tax=Streptomyces sp. YIM 130001 TaxID=2259644 RepID=UPI000EE13DC2|nr:hypothetical protein [Streptomyces sp. YIM 130001]RII13815.1 hypothetical protein DSC45_22945 [Streptomyces sp. YIM 130001]
MADTPTPDAPQEPASTAEPAGALHLPLLAACGCGSGCGCGCQQGAPCQCGG